MPATKILNGVRIDGTIKGTADVKVEGEVNGEIALSSSIYVAPGGKVKANVSANNVYVAGQLKGEVTATEFIQIAKDGIAEGDLRAPAISIEKGAKFSGRIDMSGADDAVANDTASPASPASDEAKEAISAGSVETPAALPNDDTVKVS
ncbi:MAG: hypothetical protein A2X49_11475 [Lentisphaerae bacterium GWF2_52_8]|nr:MAG: hypothetical protein A2X49_11475 [Lentisphaerae bacterium GWF2_52_8]